MILRSISLTLKHNEVLAVVGKNGVGKSTLAKAIMGMVPNISGSVRFNDKDITARSTVEIVQMGIGYFLQGGQIFPNLTLSENLWVASKNSSRAQILSKLKSMNILTRFLDKSFNNKTKSGYLSGGEKHQLALAMVLLSEPKLLILDEPSAGLSPVNSQILFEQLLRFRESGTSSILLIEHNSELIKRLGASKFVLT